MTPADLLAACRAAWPETERGRWRVESFLTNPPVAAQANRRVGPYLLTVFPRHLHPASSGDPVTHGRVYGESDEPRHVAEAPATPSGVREVVTALRAWCREEARRLAEEVDPPAEMARIVNELFELSIRAQNIAAMAVGVSQDGAYKFPVLLWLSELGRERVEHMRSVGPKTMQEFDGAMARLGLPWATPRR